MKKLGYLAPLFVLGMQCASALEYTSSTCGTGSQNIPDATGGVPGTLTCGITISGPGTISFGNAVTVSLLGFRHEASGDLIVSLSHYVDSTQTVLVGSPQYVFYQIGKTSADPNDFGYLPQFGDSFGSGDNYSFNSGFSRDLWAAAAPLGSNDTIIGFAQATVLGDPSLSRYFTTSAFSGVGNSFSSAFAGQSLAGFWLLTVTDNGEGPTFGSAGDLSQWQLGLDSSVPEPAQTALVAVALAASVIARRKLT